MPFGQVVIGPPGSGKTTYCAAMSQFLESFGRKVAVVNLDPANDILPYNCEVNMTELIKVDEVMDRMGLGPNGGLVFCMEYLEQNLDWLSLKLAALKVTYVIFDFPGQVELYTHHNSVRNILQRLQTAFDFRLVAVHLVDSQYCHDAGKFVSVLLTSLATMLQVELPHINVLSKADLIEKFGKLQFGLDFYTDVLDLSYLLEHLQGDAIFAKYSRLNKALVGVVEDYSLVHFTALSVNDKETMLRVKNEADKANGYIFGQEERSMESLMSCAMGAEFDADKIGLISEKYLNVEHSQKAEEKQLDGGSDPDDDDGV